MPVKSKTLDYNLMEGVTKMPQAKIDLRRLEAARANREIQLQKWREYDERMTRQTGAYSDAEDTAEDRLVKFQNKQVLLDAALRDDIDEVRRILEKGVDPNLAKDDGLTALHQACINNSPEMCELLLKYGANVNSRDADQWTPLHAAATCAYINICKLLLNHGADILAINVDGSIPYDIADDEETSNFLIDEITKRGITPADVEAARSEPERRMLDDIMQIYNNHGDLSTLDSQGAAPIHIAAACGYQEAANLLLQIGVDPDLRDKDDWTPAHVAVCWGQIEVVQILVAYGADLTKTTPEGQTTFELCDSDDLQIQVWDIWNKREALMDAVREDRGIRASRAWDRRRSISFVHRSSMREKSNLSKREIMQEKEMAEYSSTTAAEADSPEDRQSVEAEKKKDSPSTENGRIIVIKGSKRDGGETEHNENEYEPRAESPPPLYPCSALDNTILRPGKVIGVKSYRDDQNSMNQHDGNSDESSLVFEGNREPERWNSPSNSTDSQRLGSPKLRHLHVSDSRRSTGRRKEISTPTKRSPNTDYSNHMEESSQRPPEEITQSEPELLSPYSLATSTQQKSSISRSYREDRRGPSGVFGHCCTNCNIS
ncbi:unnamed protein product [Calicophoron daubneyi]|uniref:Protein phosphatase 1 regulatory subunit 16A n=1 Tax=Calicophoron daubneyi TaxID=300641 RepID=A0AAV2TCE3_CALDB